MEALRREILDAAWAVAEEGEIGGVSLREVARRVGLQAPSLYTYVSSKDDLFDAMFIEGYLQLEEAAVEWSRDLADMDPIDALGTVLAEWIRFCRSSLPRYQLMFPRALPGWSPSAEAYAVSERQYRSMGEELARLGIGGEANLDLYTAVAAGLAAQQLANDPTGDRWIDLAPTAARQEAGSRASRRWPHSRRRRPRMGRPPRAALRPHTHRLPGEPLRSARPGTGTADRPRRVMF